MNRKGWGAPVAPGLMMLFLALAGPGAAGADARRQVLVLQSYNADYRWSQTVGRGLAEGLRTADWDVWYEYFDAKSLPADADWGMFDAPLKAKHAGRRFEILVTVDDPAYDYYVSRRDTLFAGLPAVAVGLNGPPERRLSGVSYLIERPDFARTLNLAVRQHPRARRIHVVLDRSVTGRKVRADLEGLVLDRNLAFDWIDEGTLDQVADRVRALPPQDVLAYGFYFQPGDGYQSNDRILKRVRNDSGMPVYAFWQFTMDAGAFGGYLYDGTALGRQAAQVVRDLGPGGRPEVYLDKPQGRWAFDWHMTRTFGLAESAFPPETEFAGRPPDFWEINRSAVVGFLVVFGVLAGFTLLVLISLRAQRALVAQGAAMIATQRELMQNLGNVIETRSEETAAHVQRITRLSVRLGTLAGLAPADLQTLEVCAPMHDIGKVGIPDEILKKPGRLTPEEVAVMRTHTTIGYSIFRSSPNPLIQSAARIALEHHERWDGLGYPAGKSGADIDLLARVVAVVDVFDALLSERTYKAGWPPEEVRDFLRENTGRMFDPALAALLLDHFDEFLGEWRRTTGF